jgi:hypothetical protein
MSLTVSTKKVRFNSTDEIHEIFHRNDLSKQEADLYWMNEFDIYWMKQELTRAKLSRDPTVEKYQRENILRFNAVVRSAQRTVLREQSNFRQFQEKHRDDTNPCEERLAFAYQMATRKSREAAYRIGKILEAELAGDRSCGMNQVWRSLQAEEEASSSANSSKRRLVNDMTRNMSGVLSSSASMRVKSSPRRPHLRLVKSIVAPSA